MATKIDIAPQSSHELVLARIIDAPRANVYRCWSEPNLVTQWFAPKPWSTPRVEFDLRPGGSSMVVMADPDGNEFPNPGVFLEVDPGRRLVFTNAYSSAWEPAEMSDGMMLFTGILTFEDEGAGKTRYIARVKHWDVEGCKTHEKMGFHEGWGQCTEQLEALARTL